MNRLYKIIAYIAVSFALSWLAYVNDSTFFVTFNGIIIPLLATILAINITTSSLVAGELRKLQESHPESNIKKSTKEIKRIFKLQLALIGGLLVLFIIKDCAFIINGLGGKYVAIASNAFVIAVFVYFLEIIYDLGTSLFDIIHYNSSDKPK